MFLDLLRKKQFKMIWKIEVEGKTSYLAGSSHKFSYSFRDSLRKYIKKSKKVILEGPLDRENFENVIDVGKQTPKLSLYEMLDSYTIGLLIHKITSLYTKKTPPTFQVLADFHLGIFYEKSIREILKKNKAWMAFFLIWYEFLEIQDWKYSIDIEILKIANELNISIHFLETIHEQIQALEGIPLERIVNFFKYAEHWDEYINKYEKLYFKGELKALIKLSENFPTMCPSIIENRDPILFERMIPYLREGDSFVAVGFNHIPGIIDRAYNAGFNVSSIF